MTSVSQIKSIHLRNHRDYVNLATLQGVVIDLRYASTNNFTNENLYQDFTTAYLHFHAADKLSFAVKTLQNQHPGYSFLVFDALRPLSAQWKLWNHVEGTPQQAYIADPEKGSVHNFGMAVDLTVLDERGHELDMGTLFDSFHELAQPQLEEQFLKSGKLTKSQFANRMILRSAMLSAGFLQLPHEWWHYNAAPAPEVLKNYNLITD